MTAAEWIERFTSELGAEAPGQEEMDGILDLAAIAAHASERIAAPAVCWIGGRSGSSLDELREIANRIGEG